MKKTRILIRGLALAGLVVLLLGLSVVCFGEEGGRGGGFEEDGERKRGAGGGGEGRPHPGPDERQELTPERMRGALEILREQKPELAKRVEEAMERNPERVREMMRAHWPRLGRMLELKERDPELYRLTMQDVGLIRGTMELARKASKVRKEGDEAGAVAATAELKDLVGRQFDIRQKMQERELENLRKKTEELRARVAGRLEKKDELIQKRVEELLTISGVDWRGDL